MNRAILIGNLGADPELRFTQGGQPVLSMRLATTEKYQDKSGAKQERTDWHSLTLWGKRAEALSKILNKGDRIAVEGRIQYRDWEKDGVKRTSTDINVTDVELLGGGNRGGNGGRREDPASEGSWSDDAPF